MSLFDYMKSVQRLLRDQNQTYINPSDLIQYINESRREIALRTQCVRILSPISGSITVAEVTDPGSGYVNPAATISAPDFPSGKGAYPAGSQATASAQQITGLITNLDITYGGSGYWQPTVTITDLSGSGAGATATLSTTRVLQTAEGQEVYNLADVPLESFPGVDSIFWVNSVSIIFANYRYSLLTYSFSTYQAQIRNFPLQFQYVPAICAQLGQGTTGSLYLYPIASMPYQLEWDCFCLPSDLTDDQSVDMIPKPWQDCVKWYAAHLAFLELQNLNAAEYFRKLADERIHAFSSYARPGRVSNRYGRW